jgi:lipoate-protein ligase A
MLDEIALRLDSDIIIQAEFRLIIEPEFYRDVQAGGGRIVGRAVRLLAVRAIDQKQLRHDADPDRFARTLTAALAGQRYITDLAGGPVDLRARYTEALEVIVEAMTTPEWLEEFRGNGWRATARLEDLGV